MHNEDHTEDNAPSAMLVTRYLPTRLRHNIAWGLSAYHSELLSNRSSGYADDNTKKQRDNLIEDTRQAFALGIIDYLPSWAEENSIG